jgi:hypothetical protein
MMLLLHRALLSVGVLLLSTSAPAMTFIAEPPLLYLGGAVVKSDWPAWQEAMTRYAGEIDTIVFHESGGGDSTTGRLIGGDIRKRKLATVVYGRCLSACANMFLGGVSRQFAARLGPSPTLLGFHGTYNKDTKEVNRVRSGEYFLAMTDGKMSEGLIARFIRLESKSSLLRFVHPDQRGRQSDPLAVICGSDDVHENIGGKAHEKRTDPCEKLADVDALKQGVVTSWATRDIRMVAHPATEKATFKSWHEHKSVPPPHTPALVPAGSDKNVRGGG